MKIIPITIQQQSYFEQLDPFHMLERIRFSDSFALGAVMSLANGNAHIPIGILIGRIEKEQLLVQWLLVEETYRQQGVGDQLLTEAVHIALKKELTYVAVHMIKEYGFEMICKGAELYFKEHCFKESQDILGEWHLNIKSLMHNKAFREKCKGFEEAISLDSLNRTKTKELIQLLSSRKDTSLLYAVSEEEYQLDYNCSVLLRDQEGIRGALMVQRVGHTLYPILLSARTPEDMKAMLYAAIMSSKQKSSEVDGIRIILKDSTLISLMKKAFPDQEIPIQCLKLEAAEYQKEKMFSEQMTCAALQRELDAMIEHTEMETIEEKLPERQMEEQDYIVTLAKIQQCESLNYQNSIEKVKSIGSLELQELHVMLEQCHEIRPCTWFSENISKLPATWFESDVSCYIKEGNTMMGLLLIHMESPKKLWVEYMICIMPNMEKLYVDMLRFAVKKASEKYSMDTEVVIRCHTATVAKLLKNVLKVPV